MFKIIKELFFLLNYNQKKSFYRLQILLVVMSVFELINIVFISQYIGLVEKSDISNASEIFKTLYEFSGMQSFSDFLIYLGILLIITLVISTIISVITVWKLSLFAIRLGTELSDRLYEYYLYQDWTFHLEHNSSFLTKQLSTETNRITGNILNPLMQMNAKFVLSFFMVITLIVYNPIIALVGFLIFFITYSIIYFLIKKLLTDKGRAISKMHELRFKLMIESFGGIKDIILLGKQHNFLNKFKSSSKDLSNFMGTIKGFSEVPRYIVELITYGSIMLLILVIINNGEKDQSLISMLSLYALVGFKLIPAFQNIYGNITKIKANIPAFESVKNDLENSCIIKKEISKGVLECKSQIKFDNVSFKYLSKANKVLDKLCINIPVNSFIGIVGASGSGKSTAVDILLGLLTPQSGSVLIDDNQLNSSNIKEWQNNIGYVSQNIFLTEGSIKENIAFGLDEDEIDMEKVKYTVRISCLEEFIDNLEFGLETKVGERGIKLSGGQKQRIAIARALYNNTGILVLDEATSALDGITENYIMDSLYNLIGKRTIVMIAHRLKTVKYCDTIYIMENGTVVDYGKYNKLIQYNELFKNMSEHS